MRGSPNLRAGVGYVAIGCLVIPVWGSEQVRLPPALLQSDRDATNFGVEPGPYDPTGDLVRVAFSATRASVPQGGTMAPGAR